MLLAFLITCHCITVCNTVVNVTIASESILTNRLMVARSILDSARFPIRHMPDVPCLPDSGIFHGAFVPDGTIGACRIIRHVTKRHGSGMGLARDFTYAVPCGMSRAPMPGTKPHRGTKPSPFARLLDPSVHSNHNQRVIHYYCLLCLCLS
jgi:hypothetical protein